MRHRPSVHRRWLMPLALSALVAGGVTWVTWPAVPLETASTLPDRAFDNRQPPPPDQPSPTGAAAPTPDSAPGAQAMATYRTPDSLGEQPFASSLAGTSIDGALRANANGDLIIDLGTRDFFDYFLNPVGEVPPEVALDRIRQLAENHLPPAAAKQAMAILAQYLEYKQRAVMLQSTPLDPARQQDPAYQQAMLRQAFTDLQQLRQTLFSADAHQAFFGLEEAYGEYTLAQIAIQQRDDLTPRAKEALINWHRSQLPTPLRQTEVHLQERQEQSRQRAEILRTATTPEGAGQKLVESGMAPDEAQDVTRYLKDRQAFQARFDQYQASLSHLNDAGLSEPDRAEQQTQLLEQYFPEPQQQTWARLKMLDSNAQ